MTRKSGGGSGPEKSGPKGLRNANKPVAQLRLLTDDEVHASSVNGGGIVDESFGRQSVIDSLNQAWDLLLLEGKSGPEALFKPPTGQEDFLHAFGVALALYRGHCEDEDRRLRVSHERQLADEAMAFIAETRKRLEHTPPVLTAKADEILFQRRGTIFGNFRRRLDAELEEAWRVLHLANEALEPLEGRRGARGKPHRDHLLHRVAVFLTLTTNATRKGQLARLASAALTAVGVECPSDPRECEKLINAAAEHVRE